MYTPLHSLGECGREAATDTRPVPPPFRSSFLRVLNPIQSNRAHGNGINSNNTKPTRQHNRIHTYLPTILVVSSAGLVFFLCCPPATDLISFHRHPNRHDTAADNRMRMQRKRRKQKEGNISIPASLHTSPLVLLLLLLCVSCLSSSVNGDSTGDSVTVTGSSTGTQKATSGVWDNTHFTNCSAPCGFGLQFSVPRCVSSSSGSSEMSATVATSEVELPEEECTTRKPSVISQACFITACIVPWRQDYRCGANYAAPDGSAVSQCNPASGAPCCSADSVCSIGTAACTCATCIDYRLGNTTRTSDIAPDESASSSEDHETTLLVAILFSILVAALCTLVCLLKFNRWRKRRVGYQSDDADVTLSMTPTRAFQGGSTPIVSSAAITPGGTSDTQPKNNNIANAGSRGTLTCDANATDRLPPHPQATPTTSMNRQLSCGTALPKVDRDSSATPTPLQTRIVYVSQATSPHNQNSSLSTNVSHRTLAVIPISPTQLKATPTKAHTHPHSPPIPVARYHPVSPREVQMCDDDARLHDNRPRFGSSPRSVSSSPRPNRSESEFSDGPSDEDDEYKDSDPIDRRHRRVRGVGHSRRHRTMIESPQQPVPSGSLAEMTPPLANSMRTDRANSHGDASLSPLSLIDRHHLSSPFGGHRGFASPLSPNSSSSSSSSSRSGGAFLRSPGALGSGPRSSATSHTAPNRHAANIAGAIHNAHNSNATSNTRLLAPQTITTRTAPTTLSPVSTAALAAMQQGASSSPPSANPALPDGSYCSICLSAVSDALAIPCGHTSFCFDCISRWREIRSHCPVCRFRIDAITRREPTTQKQANEHNSKSAPNQPETNNGAK